MVREFDDEIMLEALSEMYRMEIQSKCAVPFKFREQVRWSIYRRLLALSECLPASD